MSYLNKKSFGKNAEQSKRKSSIQINYTMLNFFRNDNSRVKTLSSLNGKNAHRTNNSLYENCVIDYEKKNRAKKCLLYLLNKKSKGTFCPQILDYFKKIKQHGELNEIIEGNLEKSNKLKNNENEEKKNKSILKTEKQRIEKQAEMNFINLNKIGEKEKKKVNIKENNNNFNKDKEFNFDFKDNIIIIDNNESENTNNIENKNNLNIISQNDNHIIEQEIHNNNKNIIREIPLEKKTKKNSKKKNVKKENKIDMIYNLQRNELQKYGNYHSSLRNAIQSNIGKKKFHKKK